ncbi:enoyl-CoA hydratase/isomerase family protein [uncultured Hydrogenophaga sp.]|uniref:enoyl-CoA hydratase/isomerase family protein n=1 Tax=uncultured Hydrogenophaga sp. TaxID=199683 RepID=UPI00258961A9|nr:enoyl-CoA hydratase/isomerase family protein [uncultured Hydrogenophaga sp.]
MPYRQITYEVHEGVATLTLNRPEARNALSDTMRPELDDVLVQLRAAAGKEVKALVLTGAEGHFCAGGDVKAQRARSLEGQGKRLPHESRTRMRNDHARIIEFANLEMPVIVAVDGAAAGAGFSLALAGDYILASDRAYFVQSFGRLGLVPDWNSMYLLPRLVGLQRAKDLVFSARRLPAAEALSMGLVHSVHAPGDLLAKARGLARRFTHASTTAIALAKNILNQSLHLDNRAALEMEAMAQAIARDTPFHSEAVARFANKQPALFDWEQLAREEGA